MNVSTNKRARRLAVLLAGLLAALLLALPVAAAPQVNKTSPVNDYADILSDSTIQYVTEVSAALQSTCGAEIGVYTTEYIGNSTMEGYAYSVLNEWGLGSSDKDNGVLLLLVPGEDDYYITRGTGLESALSISTLSTILDDKLEPNWVNGDYDTGVHDTVAAIADKLCSIYGVSLDTATVSDTTSGRNGGSNIMSYIMILIAVILIIWVISTLTRPRPPRGGGPRGGAGRDMFWYSMGRASRRRAATRWLSHRRWHGRLWRRRPFGRLSSIAPLWRFPSIRRLPYRRRFQPRRRCRPSSLSYHAPAVSPGHFWKGELSYA